jgi:chaperonin cofactor prefoldin
MFTFISSSEASTNDVRVGVLYYPWYMPGNGTYHWSGDPHWIVKEIPDTIGYYSTQNVSVIKYQLDEMSNAGIDFILLSWWGPTASWEDNSCQLIFETMHTYHPEMKIFLMVEEVLAEEAVNKAVIDSFYSYMNTTYIAPYPDIYYMLNHKPLVTWWGCANITDPIDSRTLLYQEGNSFRDEVRIIGSQYYVDWSCWRPPTYDGQSATPPVNQTDGFVFIEPRYDNHFKTMWSSDPVENTTYGTAIFDENLTEGLYDSQWTTVTNRQMTNNDIKVVCIYSWNSFDERSAIEPCTDYTRPDLPHYYLLDKTKLYIDKLMIATTLRNQLDSLNESNAYLQSQLTQLNSTLQAFNDELGTQIDILNSTCNSLQTQLDSMNSTLQVSINRLQDQYNLLNSQVSTILNLQYAFAALIVILIVATIYLGTRKPKTKQRIAKTQTLKP